MRITPLTLIVGICISITPSAAEVQKKASLIFCGTQGSAGTGIGEIMVNAASEWFVVQIMPSEDLACVVLGGHGLKPVDPTKEGRKS